MSRSNDAVAAEAVAVGAGAGAVLASPVESLPPICPVFAASSRAAEIATWVA
jgi:hypothetical protein